MCDDVSGGMYEYVATRMSDVATRGRVLIKRTRYSNAERLGSRVESRNQKSLVSPTRVIHRPGSCRPETPVLHGPPAAFQRPALCTTAACVGRRVRTPGQSPPHADERNPPHASEQCIHRRDVHIHTHLLANLCCARCVWQLGARGCRAKSRGCHVCCRRRTRRGRPP